MHCMPCILRCVTLNLCRWRIVIHGGIDGYSRIPVFLKASNNNKASTVLACFLEAVSEFGLPSRVRSDKGGENVKLLCLCFHTPCEVQTEEATLLDGVSTIRQ